MILGCARLTLICAVLCQIGCASQSNKVTGSWTLPPDEQWWDRAATSGFTLPNNGMPPEIVGARDARNIREAKRRLEVENGMDTRIAIIKTDSANAFAVEQDGKRYVTMTLRFVYLIADDLDALAVTMGHEMAHHQLGHSGEQRKSREVASTAVGQVAGTLLNLAGVPLGGLIGVNATSGVFRSFTRDEERSADDLGLQWSIKAGFDPCGLARAMKMLSYANTGPQVAFLSTHPDYGQRTELANRLSVERRGRPCE